MITLDDILKRLQDAGCRPKKSGRHWQAFCPVHENPPAGHKPSLCLRLGDNGRPVLNCQRGCETEKVLAALGVSFSDFYPQNPGRKFPKPPLPEFSAGNSRPEIPEPEKTGAEISRTANPPGNRQDGRQRSDAPSDSAPVRALEEPEDGITLGKGARVGREDVGSSGVSSVVSSSSSSAAVDAVDWAAQAKRFRREISPNTLEKLAREFGVSAESLRRLEIGYDKSKDFFTFPMKDAAGRVVGLRYRPRKNPHDKYTVGQVGLFIPEGVTAGNVGGVPEGESDCAAALTRGLEAVGLPGVGKCLDALADFLWQSPVSCPCIVGDNDDAGRNGAEQVAGAMLARGIPCRVLIPPDPHKDLRAWVQAGLTATDLREAISPEQIRYPDRAAGWIPGFRPMFNNFTRRALPLLGTGPFALAVLLDSYDAGKGEIHPDRATLAEIMRVKPCTVDRYKKELKKAGVLRWRRGHKGRCNDYTINFGPCKEIRKSRDNT